MPSAPEWYIGYTSVIQLDIISPGCYKEAADGSINMSWVVFTKRHKVIALA